MYCFSNLCSNFKVFICLILVHWLGSCRFHRESIWDSLKFITQVFGKAHPFLKKQLFWKIIINTSLFGFEMCFRMLNCPTAKLSNVVFFLFFSKWLTDDFCFQAITLMWWESTHNHGCLERSWHGRIQSIMHWINMMASGNCMYYFIVNSLQGFENWTCIMYKQSDLNGPSQIL